MDMKRPGQRGVTLIELVVVIAVVVMLLAAVVPNVTAWVRNTQIRNVATSLQAGLQRARAEAMRRNTPVRFSLVSLSNSAVMDDSCALSERGVAWVVSLDDPAGKCGTAASDTTAPRIIDKNATGSGGKWVVVTGRDATNGDAETVLFDGFGRVANAGAITTLDVENDTTGDDYRALRIVVGMGGTVRMCEPKVADNNDPRKC